MHFDWTFDGCDQQDERHIERLWEEYQPELEAKLAELPVEPSELRLAISCDSESDEWEIQAALHLPTRSLTAEGTAESAEQALEQMVAALAHAVDEEGDHPTEIDRRRQGLQAVLPFLQRNRAAGRSRGFFTFLAPLVRTLSSHVVRELDVLEIEGHIAGEAVEVDDVLDEVMLRAWEKFESRPHDMPIDLWLIGLIDEIVEDLERGVPHESLGEERQVPLPEDDEQTSPYTWIEQPTYPETIELGEFLPGHAGVDSWDRLDMETKQTKLSRLLSVLSRQERQTLVLNGVEGYEPQEIARLQERPVDKVVADIETAKRKLADAMTGQS